MELSVTHRCRARKERFLRGGIFLIGALLLGNLLTLSGCVPGRNDVPPEVIGFAIYEDANENGILDAGDRLILSFDQDLTLGALNSNDFNLPVVGDSLGAGPSFSLGPSPDQLTITLGTSPAFTVRGFFQETMLAVGNASGVDVSENISEDSLVGDEGETAESSVPADLVPGYLDSGQIFVSYATRDVVSGDFDGDGEIDVFLANESEGNRVLLNSGAGVFVDTTQSLGSAPSFGAAVADFDADGDLDIAVANEFGVTNLVWENDGTGAFAAGATFGGHPSRDVAAGDFNGDGRPDLIVANQGANRVWFNVGTSFVESQQTLGLVSSRAVAAADFDLDGDLDVAFANDSGVSRVWRNNGVGLFTEAIDLIGPMIGESIAVGDIDHDGFQDVVIGSLDDGATSFLNVGPSTFVADPPVGNGSVRAVGLADVDADGDLDLIEGRTANFPDRIWFNDSIGFFFDSGMELGSLSTRGVAIADYDRDGDLDLFTGSSAESSRLYVNPLSASQAAFGLSDTGQDLRNNSDSSQNMTTDATLADLDADGDLDYLNGASPNGTARAWINDGAGVFSLGPAFGSFGVAAVSVAAGDLDGNGTTDVLVGREGQQTLILSNTGGANFNAIGSIAMSVSATHLRLVNLDADGDLDLISASGSTTRVFFNDGNAFFTDSGQSLGSSAPSGLATAALDPGISPDLVIGIDGGGNLVFTNDGIGNFTNTGQSLGMGATQDVLLADVDGDGDIDICEARDGGNRVWRNDGFAVFTDTLQNLGTMDTRCIAAADLNLDGSIDLIEANAGSANRVLLNDGAGIFTDSGVALISSGTSRVVVLGDLNQDGSVDAIFGTTVGDAVFLQP